MYGYRRITDDHSRMSNQQKKLFTSSNNDTQNLVYIEIALAKKDYIFLFKGSYGESWIFYSKYMYACLYLLCVNNISQCILNSYLLSSAGFARHPFLMNSSYTIFLAL